MNYLYPNEEKDRSGICRQMNIQTRKIERESKKGRKEKGNRESKRDEI